MKRFYEAKDVQQLLQVGETSAYRVIQRLNRELEQKGYLTVRAKVPAQYLQQRYGIEEDGSETA